jgi:uncharacterized membrane protein
MTYLLAFDCDISLIISSLVDSQKWKVQNEESKYESFVLLGSVGLFWMT